jgi:flagellar basal-body rod protein FlgB
MSNKIAQFLFDGTGVPKNQKYLDLASFRHKLISGNIANASTPGYRAKEINFESEYRRLTNQSDHVVGMTTDPNHLPIGNTPNRPPKVEQERVKVDEMNSVDIDKEIPALAKNELTFTVGAKLLQLKFDGIKKAITSK